MSHSPAPETASPAHPNALPAGTRLAEFELRAVIAVGGFGIVYRAFDPALEREVAIKEYMPSALAARASGQATVVLRSAGEADLFALGLRSFVNEARLLARFDHPSLVKVYRFWEQHGTAYMVMPLYAGRTLKQACDAGDGPADEAALLRVVVPVLGALEVLHEAGVYHRDVAPDNILLGDDGVPVLLDFGAARRVVGDQTQRLTAILKPRFAPIEQYADVSHLPQGPWTDLYSLAAVMHFVVTGVPPVSAAARAVDDQLAPLAALEHARFGVPLRRAIDWGLALRPQQRPQDVARFRDALEGRIEAPARAAAAQGDASRWLIPPVTAHAGALPHGAPPDEPPAIDRVPADPAPMPDAVPALSVPAAPVVVLPRRWRWIGRAVAVLAAGLIVSMWLREPEPGPSRTVAVVHPPRVAVAGTAAPTARPPALVERADGEARAVAAAASGARKLRTEPARRPVAAPAVEAVSPDQACGERAFLMRALCVQRECAKPQLRDHAQCVRMRHEMAERRERVAQP